MIPEKLNLAAYRAADLILDLSFETTEGHPIDLATYSEIAINIYQSKTLINTIDLTGSITPSGQIYHVFDKISWRPIIRHEIKFVKNDWAQFYCNGRIFIDDAFTNVPAVCTPKTLQINPKDVQLRPHFPEA